MQGKHIYG